MQHRWALGSPGSFCGHCKGRDLRETELKTLQTSMCCYILLVLGLTDQSTRYPDTWGWQPHLQQVCVFAGGEAACGGAVRGFLETWNQELAWASTQLALCVVILQPLNCITMEMRLTALQDWKIPGNRELLEDFFVDFFFFKHGCFRNDRCWNYIDTWTIRTHTLQNWRKSTWGVTFLTPRFPS